MDKWEFKKIFNIYNEQIDEHGLIYYIKWKYYNKKNLGTQEIPKMV